MKACLMLVMVAIAPGAMAANCDSSPNNQIDLQNAPAQEMQSYRASKPSNCVTASQFAARPKAKTPVPGSGGSSVVTKPVTPDSQPATGGGYVPKTKDDNTPYRFDMTQNGKRMTSEEFDAWMRAKGIRVATGKPGGAAEPVVTKTAEPECKPTKRKKCK